MSNYTKAMEVVTDLFSKDTVFALATIGDKFPSVRMIDAYYEEGYFYIITHGGTQKAKDIEANPLVALTKDMHRFAGRAENLGHPFKPENRDIRLKLKEAVKDRLFKRDDQSDEDLIILKVKVINGFFYQDDIGYDVNFEDQTLETFDFGVDLGL